EGGGVEASGVTGALNVNTGAGSLSASNLPTPSAAVRGEGGGVSLGSLTAPASVRVDTGGGDASLSVPGGTYAVTADTGGSQESVLIATSPGAANSISVNTEGGNLQ